MGLCGEERAISMTLKSLSAVMTEHEASMRYCIEFQKSLRTRYISKLKAFIETNRNIHPDKFRKASCILALLNSDPSKAENWLNGQSFIHLLLASENQLKLWFNEKKPLTRNEIVNNTIP